jgi:hypothetical protein
MKIFMIFTIHQAFRVIKSRITRWLAHMGERRSAYRVLAEKTERDHL